MIEHFKVTLDLLKKVNLRNGKINNHVIMSDDEFLEQYDNLIDFQEVLHGLNSLLEQANQHRTLKEIESDLHKIHIKYSDYIWHINEIHETIKKIIAGIP